MSRFPLVMRPKALGCFIDARRFCTRQVTRWGGTKGPCARNKKMAKNGEGDFLKGANLSLPSRWEPGEEGYNKIKTKIGGAGGGLKCEKAK